MKFLGMQIQCPNISNFLNIFHSFLIFYISDGFMGYIFLLLAIMKQWVPPSSYSEDSGKTLYLFFGFQKKKIYGVNILFLSLSSFCGIQFTTFHCLPRHFKWKNRSHCASFLLFQKTLILFFFWFVGLGFRNDYNMMKLKFQLHPCAIFFFALAFLVCLLLLWLSSNSVSSFKMCSFFC